MKKEYTKIKMVYLQKKKNKTIPHSANGMTPHVKIGTHLIEAGDYIIPPKEVLRLMDKIMRVVY